MSLDLGELGGTLVMDITPLERALALADGALDSFAASGESTARSAGTQIGGAVADGLDVVPVAAREAATGIETALAGAEAGARAAGTEIATGVGQGLAMIPEAARTAATGLDAIPEAARLAAGDFITVLADLPKNIDGTVSRASTAWRQLPLDARLAGIEMNREITMASQATAADVGRALDGAGAQLGAAGRSAGQEGARGLAAGLDQAKTEAESAGREAGSRFADRFSDGAKDAGKVAGAAIGVALGAGVADNINVDAGRRRLAAQLALTKPEAAEAGRLAGAIYANNFGEDLGQINTALALVVRNMNLDLASVEIQPAVEKVLTLADVFEQDLAMTTAAAGQMVRTGMAKDISEALDIITVGLQGPANKADDLLETWNEYGTQFRKVGLDGAAGIGLISQAMEAGARDSDIAADAIKEFSIRTMEALEQTDSQGRVNMTALGAAFTNVIGPGKDMYKVQADLAKGGKPAREAFDMMLDGLRNIKDPADRSKTAVALFGTQAEDLGASLYAMDVTTAVKGLGDVAGAADRVVEVTGEGPQATIESYKRRIVEWGRGMVESTGPTAALAGAVAAFGPVIGAVLGPLSMLVAARGTQAAAAGAAATAEVAAGATTKVSWISSAAVALASGASMAMAWLIAIAPIAIAIAAVAGVVYLVVKYWDDIKAATLAVWDWVVDKVKAIPGLLVGFFMNFTLVGLIIKHWDDIKAGTKAAWDWVVDKVKAIPGLLVGFFMNWTLIGLIIKHWDSIKSGTKTAWDNIVDFVKAIPGKIVGFFMDWTLVGQIIQHWDQAKAGTIRVAGAIVDWVQELPGKIIGKLASLGGSLRDTAVDAFQRFRDAAGSKVDAFLDFIKGIPGRVLAVIGDLSRVLYDKGRSLIQGLIDGIKSLIDQIPNPMDYLPDIPGLGRVAVTSKVITAPAVPALAPAETYASRTAAAPPIDTRTLEELMAEANAKAEELIKAVKDHPREMQTIGRQNGTGGK